MRGLWLSAGDAGTRPVREDWSYLQRAGGSGLLSLSEMAIRCLIVDDSPQFGQLAHELLGEEGIDILGVAADAEEAERLARHLRPDLALVDIDLGGDSGLAVARRLRGNRGTALAAAVILISTHAEDEFAELIEASLADGFLAKSELSAEAIRELLGRSEQALGS
jgi:DNA-binding NarL/FixJ family response regulator